MSNHPPRSCGEPLAVIAMSLVFFALIVYLCHVLRDPPRVEIPRGMGLEIEGTMLDLDGVRRE